MRSYSINLTGRVKNFSLPKNRPLIPIFEAVVNSIHAIEERKKEDKSFNDGKISIDILRAPQMSLLNELNVESFIVTDNGIGFTERNMQSFFESDSTYKASIGGKGVGRFSWLKVFESANIFSVFKDKGSFVKREFTFSMNDLSIDDKLSECVQYDDYYTKITLCTVLPEYKKEMPKQIETIALHIVQHCLVYFLDNDCPNIIIRDKENYVLLNQIFKDKFKTEDATMKFFIKDEEFNLLNVKIEEKAFSGNRLYLCANNRLVDSKNLEKQIVDLDGQIFEHNGFWYVGVLTSAYLDKYVDMNRLSFNILDRGVDLLDEISLEEIINESCRYVKEYLHEYLISIETEKSKRIKDYVSTEAPQYRHLLKHMPEQIANIKPKLTDDKLDEALYEIKREFDKTSKKEQKLLLEKLNETNVTSDEYECFFKSQVEKISDANNAVLAEYIAHRRVIIELLERGLRRKEDGKFNKEKYMHNLIYPMKYTGDEIDYEAHNLWLIDERLSYCTFISSDIPFDNDYKQERTDILILDNPVVLSDNRNDGTVFDTIIIFELKRPMRDDYTDSDNPIKQLYDYVRKIRKGEANDKYHRQIKVNDSTKYYLYAVCDITKKIEQLIEQYNFNTTPDMIGYYGFNDKLNTYFEILSYDKILLDAKKRNRVLFDKLGI